MISLRTFDADSQHGDHAEGLFADFELVPSPPPHELLALEKRLDLRASPELAKAGRHLLERLMRQGAETELFKICPFILRMHLLAPTEEDVFRAYCRIDGPDGTTSWAVTPKAVSEDWAESVFLMSEAALMAGMDGTVFEIQTKILDGCRVRFVVSLDPIGKGD